MDAAVHIPSQSRGAELLLYHCVSLGRSYEPRVPAFERLELLLGGELARLLLNALAPGQRRDAVSSSP